jgi:hypothetical protein
MRKMGLAKLQTFFGFEIFPNICLGRGNRGYVGHGAIMYKGIKICTIH